MNFNQIEAPASFAFNNATTFILLTAEPWRAIGKNGFIMDVIESVLYEIKKKEYQLRNLSKSKSPSVLYGEKNHTTGPDLIRSKDLDLMLAFLIASFYNGVFDKKVLKDFDDVSIEIGNLHTDSILNLWNRIKLDYQNQKQLLEMIDSYHLNEFKNSINDKLVIKWLSSNLLFTFNVWDSGGIVEINHMCARVLLATQEKIGVNLIKGSCLVRGDCQIIAWYYFEKANDDMTLTFVPSSYAFFNRVQLVLCFWKALYPNVQCLECIEDNTIVFPFEEILFDNVLLFLYDDKEDYSLIEESLIIVSDNGLCFAPRYNTELIDKDTFSKWSFPIIFRNIYNNSVYAYLCVKEKSVSSIVRYVDIHNPDEENLLYENRNSITDFVVECINNDSFRDECMILDKEDFIIHSDDITRVERKKDQRDWVYRPVQDMIIFEDNDDEFLLTSIPNQACIVDLRFPTNPFYPDLPEKYYLDSKFQNVPDDKDIHNEFSFVKDENQHCKLFCTDAFLEKLRYHLSYRGDIHAYASEYYNFFNRVQCRITRKARLLSCGNKLVKVYGTEQNPICYQNVSVYPEYDYLESEWIFEPVFVNPEYDEDFVIWARSNWKYSDRYMLIPPTVERQHEFFLKMKDEYDIKNASLIQATREDERRRISIDLHYLKHDAAQYLSSINSAAQLIINKMKDDSLSVDDTIVPGYTVNDKLTNISKSTKRITEFLKQMIFLTDNVVKTPKGIKTLLEEFVNGCLKSNYYGISLSINENMEGVMCLLDERINKVFTNILSNAERHAFTNKRKKDYQLIIDAKKENDVIVITFKNNGTPPDSTLTEEGFFTRGMYVGETGHSGFGGSIIRDTIEAQGGIVHLLLNENNEYPFIIEIKLPVYHD